MQNTMKRIEKGRFGNSFSKRVNRFPRTGETKPHTLPYKMIGVLFAFQSIHFNSIINWIWWNSFEFCSNWKHFLRMEVDRLHLVWILKGQLFVSIKFNLKDCLSFVLPTLLPRSRYRCHAKSQFILNLNATNKFVKRSLLKNSAIKFVFVFFFSFYRSIDWF